MMDKQPGILDRLNSQAKTGAVALGPAIDPAEKEYTVVVFGTPRGGTTMMAGVVQKLGIDLGGGRRFNLEDPAFDRQTVDDMLNTIEARNAKKPVWGWKFPAAARTIGDLLPRLRNPRFIVVWRDPFTAALRSIEGLDDMDLPPQKRLRRSLKSIQNIMELQLVNIEAIRAAGCPTLMISYEKTMRRPEAVIADIASFISRPMPEDISELREFMQPESYK